MATVRTEGPGLSSPARPSTPVFIPGSLIVVCVTTPPSPVPVCTMSGSPFITRYVTEFEVTKIALLPPPTPTQADVFPDSPEYLPHGIAAVPLEFVNAVQLPLHERANIDRVPGEMFRIERPTDTFGDVLLLLFHRAEGIDNHHGDALFRTPSEQFEGQRPKSI